MLKALRRIVALFAFVALIFGAIRSFFQWIAQSEEDNHEVFADEDSQL